MGFRWALVSFPALAVAAGASACSSSSESAAHSSATTTTAGADSGVDAAPSQLPDGCPVNSGYPGDSMCLAAPPADKGFQLKYGPPDYTNPADEEPYILAPNSEINDCYYEKTTNTTDQYVSGYQFSMRQGSHHIIMNVNATAQADGFATCQANDQTPGLLGASETPTVDEITDPAPENQGLAVKIPANSQAVVNFHVINTSAKPILREAWLNYFYIDPSEVKGIRGNVFLVGGLGYQITPGTNQTYQYSCSPDRPVRVLSLAAHMHAATTRLSMWKVTNGQANMIYEGYDWANPVAFFYDSVHQNPAPNRAARIAGASTGALTLQPGDSIQWECAVQNNTDVTLTFRNEVYTGEMCIVAGTMVPADDPMNPYDFTCSLN
jgi:hypothetical protein